MRPVVIGALVVAFMVGAVPSGQAQYEGARVAVTDLDFDDPLSPSFRTGVLGVTGTRQNWLQIALEYETDAEDGEWINEIVLQWTVALTAEGKRPVLMRRRVTYRSIEDGDHYAVMYVRPKFIQHYFDRDTVRDNDIRVYLEILADGNRATRFRYPERGRRAWWQAGEPNVIIRDDELLTRNETPFAPLEYDYYEHIIPQP